MKSLKILAQDTLDLFEGDYQGNTSFFDLEQVERLCFDAFAAQLQEDYDKEYAIMRQGKQMDMVRFDKGWLQVQTCAVQKDGDRAYVKLKVPVMSFLMDHQSVGIQDIIPMKHKGTCNDFIRTSVDELWQIKQVPSSSTAYWYLLEDEIEIVKSTCLPEALKIIYLPAMQEGIIGLPEGKAEIISRRVVERLKGEKDMLIDKTNDLNKNIIPQTEINKDQLK